MIEGAILLVGCGKLGGALLDGWFKRGMNPVDIIIVEPAGRNSIATCAKHPALTVLAKASDVPSDFRPDAVIFAVKPQIIDSVVGDYARFLKEHPLFLSVIAGKTIAYFKRALGPQASVVRAMPNTPAAVGKAITVLAPSPEVDATQRAVCELLMSAVGQIAWTADEGLMDAVTAVSGSGPAYVFLLAEALAAAGEKAGLPPELAARLARATVAGAGAMLEQAAESPAQLRQNVSSPGGTTLAALGVLMGERGLQPLMDEAIAAAAKRSKELAG